jgi:hypothetical protein
MKKTPDSPKVEKSAMSLPELEVAQEKYCSQEMVDRILRFLQDKQPDYIRTLLNEAKINPLSDYRNELLKLPRYLENSGIEVPNARLGMIDLTFEVHRRVMKAIGGWMPEIRGNPIGESPTALSQPMVKLPVGGLKAKSKTPADQFVSQELADDVVDAMFKRRPDLLYEFAEEIRRDITIEATYKEFVKFMQDIVQEIPTSGGQWPKLAHETYRRISVVAGIR